MRTVSGVVPRRSRPLRARRAIVVAVRPLSGRAARLSADEAVDIKFHCNEPSEYWDLKVVDKEGNEIVWQNLNLLKISKVTLEYKDSTPTAVVE